MGNAAIFTFFKLPVKTNEEFAVQGIHSYLQVSEEPKIPKPREKKMQSLGYFFLQIPITRISLYTFSPKLRRL